MVPNVRFGSKADMCSAIRHVRFTPESGHVRCKEDVRFVPKADIDCDLRISSVTDRDVARFHSIVVRLRDPQWPRQRSFGFAL
jgi:hypothetical protein